MRTSRTSRALLALAAGWLAGTLNAQDAPPRADVPPSEPRELDALTVTAAPAEDLFGLLRDDGVDPVGFRRFDLDLSLPDGTSPDVTRWMRRVPGAAPIGNGPLSGQVQLRGMWGPRVDVRIDDMYINSGGPNWMDPTLHYAPRGILRDMEVYRGLAPVSAGPETIGGAVRVRTRSGRLTDSRERSTRGNLGLSKHSVDHGDDGSLFLAIEDDRDWVHLYGTAERGEDREFGRPGRVASTRYDREQLGIGYGWKVPSGLFAFDYRRQDTDDTGTAALPMDIRYFDTEILRLRYEGSRGDTDIRGQLYYSNIDHLMDNFTLRPPPDFFTPMPMAPPMIQMVFGGTDRRSNNAKSDGLGLSLSSTRPRGDGELRLGAELHLAEHDTLVTDPDSPMRTTPFSGIERDRYSLFAEWEGPMRGAWDLEAGLRLTSVHASAGAGITPGMPAGATLQQRFAAADRSKEDLLVDVVTRFTRSLREGFTLEVGLGRKARAPSYVERFAYLPTEATSGFADTNKTVGNLTLNPEVAYTLDLGVSWRTADAYLSPRVFYSDVDDFIQQTPTNDPTTVMVSTMNGDPTPLQFNNTDAKFWGADAAFGRRLDDRWRLDGTVSYVRGRRKDVNDDLFRIAPLNGTLGVTHTRRDWSFTAQGVFAAEQRHVSATNGEPFTPGYGTLNLFAQRRTRRGVRLTAGVENVFDKYFRDHLSSFNRVLGSAVGAVAPPPSTANRIPGAGRNFFLRVDLAF